MIITISVTVCSLLGVLFAERRFRKRERSVSLQERVLVVLLSIREHVQARDFPIQEALAFHKGQSPQLDKALQELEKVAVFKNPFYSKEILLVELDSLIRKQQEVTTKALNKLAGEHLIYIYLGLLTGFLAGLGYGIFIL